MRGKAIDRGLGIVTVMALGAAALLLAGLGQAKPAAAPPAEAASPLANAEASEAELAQLAGGTPERCVHAGPNRKLCSWPISGRLIRPGGDAAAASAEVVTLICELPVRSDSDARGPCRAHPGADLSTRNANAGADLPPVSSRGDLSQAERRAVWAELSEARTVTALSHLVGAVPNVCRVRLVADHQRCEWRISTSQGRLAALAPSEGNAVLRCALPLDGSDRAASSCGIVGLD